MQRLSLIWRGALVGFLLLWSLTAGAVTAEDVARVDHLWKTGSKDPWAEVTALTMDVERTGNFDKPATVSALYWLAANICLQQGFPTSAYLAFQKAELSGLRTYWKKNERDIQAFSNELERTFLFNKESSPVRTGLQGAAKATLAASPLNKTLGLGFTLDSSPSRSTVEVNTVDKVLVPIARSVDAWLKQLPAYPTLREAIGNDWVSGVVENSPLIFLIGVVFLGQVLFSTATNLLTTVTTGLTTVTVRDVVVSSPEHAGTTKVRVGGMTFNGRASPSSQSDQVTNMRRKCRRKAVIKNNPWGARHTGRQ